MISCETSTKGKENNLRWYIKNFLEGLLEGVKVPNVIECERICNKTGFKRTWENEKIRKKSDKHTYEQLIHDMPETTGRDETWQMRNEKWLRSSDIKRQTEALVCVEDKQALRTDQVKHNIYKTDFSPFCRSCDTSMEIVNHIVNGCEKPTYVECKRRHNNVTMIVHWKLYEKFGLHKNEKRYEHDSEPFTENKLVKLLKP